MREENSAKKTELEELRALHRETTQKLKEQQEESSRKLSAYAAEIGDALSEVHRMASGMEDLQTQVSRSQCTTSFLPGLNKSS